MSKIGFIGLGNMGLLMAVNLVKAGHRVTGFDVVSAARQAAGAAGVKIVDSVSEASLDQDILLTMLPNGQLVLNVYNGILQRAHAGTLLVDSSTIDDASARGA